MLGKILMTGILMISYKGTGHGIPIFNEDPTLQTTMVDWFADMTNP